MLGSSRLTGLASRAWREIEAMRTLISAQFTMAGSSSLAAILKKPPKKNTAAPTAMTIASTPMPARIRIGDLPFRNITAFGYGRVNLPDRRNEAHMGIRAMPAAENPLELTGRVWP